MYQVSNLCKEALGQYKRDLRFRIYMDDKIIEENDIIDFTISEGIIPGENFELGGAVASTFSVKINNLHESYSNVDFKDKELKVYIGIVISNGSTEYVPMGIFTVDEYKEESNFINIEALDNMIKFEEEYESKLTYPTTAKLMLQEICSLCGVKLSTMDFLNDSYVIEKPIEKDTCRSVLRDLAILAGAFAKVNRQGELILSKPIESNLEINKDNYIKLDLKEAFLIGNYVVTETYFPVDTILLNLNVVPFVATWQGNIALDVGDKISLNDDKKIVKSIVTKQKIKFNGGLAYETECSGLSEQQQKTQLVNQKQVNRRFASEIKQNADEIALRVTSEEFEAVVQILDGKIDLRVTSEEFKSGMEILDGKIELKVSAEDLESIVTQNAESWELSINGKLTGRTYRFDGEGFTLGGTEGDVAKHTPSGSEWRFTDGSIAIIDKDGFYNMFGGSRRGYHHLNYSTFVTKDVYMSYYQDYQYNYEEYFYLDLPEEFKNKYVNVNVNMSHLRYDATCIQGNKVHWAIIENNKIKVYVSLSCQPVGYVNYDNKNSYVLFIERNFMVKYRLDITLTA